LVQRSGLSTFTGREAFAGATGATLEANIGRLDGQVGPGARFEYSNANYDALALIVQRASNRTFEDYLRAEVFAPLGMRATTDPERARDDGLAVGYYHWLGLGYRPVTPPLPDGTVGSYRMFASAADLARIVTLHLEDGTVAGQRVLTPASMAVLQSGEPLEADSPVSYAGGLFVDDPGSPWMQGAIADHSVIRHDGSALSYRSYLWAMPDAGVGLVLLANANNWADETQLPRVAHNVQHILFGVPPGPMSGEPAVLTRWGKHIFALVALAQILLAVTMARPLRRVWRGGQLGASGRSATVAASLIDLLALASLLWLIPTVTVAPMAVVLQAPDARILITLMGLGVAWGAIRTVLLGAGTSRRQHPTPANRTGLSRPRSSTLPDDAGTPEGSISR
jgi:CubicO group peptidase (beta-lactamase class C family)